MEYKFLFSYILILIALYFSYREKLGLEKTIFINSLRALFQLLFLGYILVFIFKLKNPIELTTILIFMTLFAAYTAQKRTKLKEKGFIIAFFSIFFASVIVLTSMLILGVISFKPNQIIPVGGMIIGNSLNVYSLTIDRMKGEAKNTIDIIENLVAIGSSLKEAFFFIKRNALKAALIPVMNMLQTVGIIHIPGITTGMLLAGASPVEAVFYQLAIMYMMVAVALFTGLFAINFSYKEILGTVTENR